MKSRNDPLGFAERTLKNLDHITQAYPDDDVHVVAQTGNSLLGLIVFPFARGLQASVKEKKIADLIQDGWPPWNYTEGSPRETLGEFINDLRNAVAHGRWRFTSNSRDCSAVRIEVAEPKCWKADIGCLELQLFCRKFVGLLQ